MLSRSSIFLSSILVGALALVGCSKSNEQTSATQSDTEVAAPDNVRIGYQRSSTLVTLLKESGELEQRFKEKDINISWHEFTSGQPLLEALNVGSIDVTADVADTVPVFAQAAGAALTYYAKETASPNAQAILIPKNSTIKSVAELKGKKIAVTKAAGSHYLLIAALNQAGLKFSDIQPAWLSPADGRAAFEHGSVDAWVTWEPYVSSGQVQQGAKILTSGEGIADYKRYYLTSQKFAKSYPDVIKTVVSELEKKAAWVKSNPEDAAKVLAPLWGDLPLEVVVKANQNRSYNVQPVVLEDMTEQQKISDAFFNEKLIPNTIEAEKSDLFKF